MVSRMLGAVAAMSLAGVCIAETVQVDYSSPSLDRWMYPFNFTPGTRSTASTFGALGEPDFDNRDGQFIVGWDTAGDVTPGLGESSYSVVTATVRVATDAGGFAYDGTLDPVESYFTMGDPDFVVDADAGRPIEIYGIAYRNGFDGATFVETSPFGPNQSTNRSVRNAFAIDFFGGSTTDVSNNVDERFEVRPFAVGHTAIAPGAATPADTDFVFTLNVGDPDVQTYLRRALDSGRTRFVISSLHPAVQQGGEFASWYTKENLFGAGRAARLELEVVIGSPTDLNGDGETGGSDLAALLAAWGQPGPSDFDGDGETDGSDLATLLASWTP